MAINIVDLTNKQENQGKDDSGVLRAEEFNRLVDAVIETQTGLNGVVRGVRFGMGAQPEFPDTSGIVTIQSNVTDTYKFSMISPDGQYATYADYMNSFPSYILAGESFNVRVRVSFTEKIDDVDTSIKTPLKVNFKVGSNIVYSTNIYDYNLKDNLIKDSEKTVSFNFAPYLAKNAVNEVSFEIIDAAVEYPRIATQTRIFNKVFVVNTEVSLKLEGTVNNLNIYNYDSLENEHANIVVTTTSSSGKLSLYETSMPGTPIFEIPSIDNTTTNIRINNARLNDIVRQHGTHNIYAVLKYSIPGTDETIDVKSNEVSYIFYNNNAEQTEPLVSINKVSAGIVFKEYGQVILNYLVYLPEVYEGGKDLVIKTYPVGKAFDDSNLIISKTYTIIPETITSNIVEGNVSYLLSHIEKSTQIESGKYNMVIQFENFTQTLEIEIEKSSVNLENYNILGQICYFKSSDKSPGDKEWSYVYEDTNNDITETYSIKFNNFDFSEYGSGFKSDTTIDGGQTILSIKRGSSIEVPYPIFSKPLQLESAQGGSTGKTISVEFKTYNCISQVKPIITCMDFDVPENDRVGFIVYPNKIEVKTGTQKFEAKFKEDEHIKLDFVVEGNYTEYHNPTVSGTKGEYTDDKPSSEALMIVYVNGVYQRLHLIGSTSDTFSSYIKNGAYTVNNSPIIIGSEGCDIDLYNIKLYEKPLSSKEIVFNYAFDTPRFEDRIAIINRNDIWTDAINDISKLYDISRDKLESHLPDLPIFSFVMHESNKDNLPVDKKNWKFLTKSTYYNKNIIDGNKDTGNISWSANSSAFRNQGTSSMNYPMPWRNWDWKTDTDVATESGALKEGDPILDTLSKKFFKYDGFTELGKTWKQYDNMPDGIRKITFKKDYASSEMCNNAICSSLFTDMAIVAGAKSDFKNVLMPTGSLDKYGYRLSLIATPCFMYQELTGENTGKTKTLGMMNLIPNKNETSYLGLGDVDARTWNILEILKVNDLDLYTGESKVSRAQAWEVAENHVIWDKKYESYSVADVLADRTGTKYPNIKNNTQGLAVKIDFDKLTDKDNKELAEQERLNAIASLKAANSGLTESELATKYDYYVIKDGKNNNIFLKVTDDNADKVGTEGYIPALSFESFGTYINSILNNYEARYPKDSSGVEMGDDEVNIWGGDEADFGFAPDSDWIFSDEKITIGDLEVTQSAIVNAETRDIIRFHNWLVDCHPALVKEGAKITIDGVQKDDTLQNRLDKFKAEAKDYLIIEQWILYYIWRELFWMFDSGSKNLQIYTIDGIHWGCMVRDADTALGINNLGVEMFPAYLEDIDYFAEADGKINFFFNDAKGRYSVKQITDEVHAKNNRLGAVSTVMNGQMGSIWLNLRDSYKSDIKKMAQYLFSESTNKFTANSLIREFDSHQEKWSESLYNFGMRQYFGGPLFTKWMTSGNGDKKLSRKDWLTKAFDYRIGKYQCYPDDQSCNINWRATSINFYGFEGGIKPADIETTNLKFKFYQPCYLWSGGSSSGIHNSTIDHRITTYGDEVVNIPMNNFAYPGDGSSESNMYIYGMHNVTDLGPLYKSLMFADFNPFNALTKVTKLELGHKEWSKQHKVKYSGIGEGKSLTFNGMPKLQYLDITNYDAVPTINVNECSQLEELYMEGTDAVNEIILPKTITLHTVRLGKNIKNIDLSDLTGLTSVRFESLNQLNTFKCLRGSDYMKKESFNILKNSPNLISAEVDVNWGEDDPIDVNDLINFINKGFKIKGTVRVANLTFEQKLVLMASQPDNNGNIDTVSPEMGLRVETAAFVQLQNVEVSPKLSYAGVVGANYTLSFTPDNANANNFYKIEWSFEDLGLTDGDPSEYVKILSDDAVLTFKRIGEYIAEPAPGTRQPTIEARVKIHCYANKEKTSTYTREATANVRIYDRQPKVGDIVYHDGTTSSVAEVDRSKIAIGVCFYIDEDDPTLRLMVALKEFNSKYIPSINYSDSTINLIRWGATRASNINLLNYYDGFNIDDIKNISNYESIVDPSLIRTWSQLRTADNLNWVKDTNVILGLPPSYAFGELGYKEVKDEHVNGFNYLSVSDTNHNVQVGDKLPYGKFNTLSIISVRNMILTDPGVNPNYVAVPQVMMNGGNEVLAEYTVLESRMKTTYDYYATYENHHNMIDAYYACASYCYGYTPYLQSSGMPVLDPKFRTHQWFLPSAGEMMRLGFYINAYGHPNSTNTEFDIFTPIFQLAQSDASNPELDNKYKFTFDGFTDNMKYATSTEYKDPSQVWFVDAYDKKPQGGFTNDTYMYIDTNTVTYLSKNYNSNRPVRPICMF